MSESLNIGWGVRGLIIVALGLLLLFFWTRERGDQRRAIEQAARLLGDQLDAATSFERGTWRLHSSQGGRAFELRLSVAFYAQGDTGRGPDYCPVVEVDVPVARSVPELALYPRDWCVFSDILRRAWLSVTIRPRLSFGDDDLDAHFVLRGAGARELSDDVRDELRRNRAALPARPEPTNSWEAQISRGRARWREVFCLSERKMDGQELAHRIRARLPLFWATLPSSGR